MIWWGTWGPWHKGISWSWLHEASLKVFDLMQSLCWVLICLSGISLSFHDCGIFHILLASSSNMVSISASDVTLDVSTPRFYYLLLGHFFEGKVQFSTEVVDSYEGEWVVFFLLRSGTESWVVVRRLTTVGNRGVTTVTTIGDRRVTIWGWWVTAVGDLSGSSSFSIHILSS